MHLAQDQENCWAVVNRVKNLWVPYKDRNSRNDWQTISVYRNISPWSWLVSVKGSFCWDPVVYPKCVVLVFVSHRHKVEVNGWIIVCLHRETRHKKPLRATEQYRYGGRRILGFCMQVARLYVVRLTNTHGTLLLQCQINDRTVQWLLITKTAWRFNKNS